jgi:predicted enzyme related to lactoylglutathione lyase
MHARTALVLLPLLSLLALPAASRAAKPRPPAFDGGLTCVLQVADLDRAWRWYEEVLGFRVVYALPDIGWCELATPVTGVNVGLSLREKREVGGGTLLTFGVRDVEETERRLKAAGVATEPVRVIPDLVRLLPFSDPDGNALQVYEPLMPRSEDALEPVAFLAGSWRGAGGTQAHEEYWTPPEGGTMLGCSRLVRDGRTASFEYLRIERDGDGLVYQASPGGRPATPFRMVHAERGKAVFENLEHDFPQRITYWLDDDGVLHARIEDESGAKRRDFAWERAALSRPRR